MNESLTQMPGESSSSARALIWLMRVTSLVGPVKALEMEVINFCYFQKRIAKKPFVFLLYLPCVYDSMWPNLNDDLTVEGLRRLGLMLNRKVVRHRDIPRNHRMILVCVHHCHDGDGHA